MRSIVPPFISSVVRFFVRTSSRSFVRSIVRSLFMYVRPSFRSFVHSLLVRSFFHSKVCSFHCLFVRSSIRCCIRSFVRAFFVRTSFRSFVRAFVRSYELSFVRVLIPLLFFPFVQCYSFSCRVQRVHQSYPSPFLNVIGIILIILLPLRCWSQNLPCTTEKSCLGKSKDEIMNRIEANFNSRSRHIFLFQMLLSRLHLLTLKSFSNKV